MTLLINDVPIACIHQAAVTYQVPATLIISVLKTENGRVGMANKNHNGSYDYGPMQINSVWLPIIANYGYTKFDIQFNACTNVKIGAWILNQKIDAETQLWKGIGDYNSHTPKFNQMYVEKVYANYVMIEHVINCFP